MKLAISRPPGYILSAIAISLGGFLNGFVLLFLFPLYIAHFYLKKATIQAV
jgi:hypothetical protein